MAKPSIRMGALVGFGLSAALTAVLYAGEQVARLPFVPFDLFDWLTRLLPGAIVTFAIESLVDVLMLLGLDVAETAKLAEQTLAVVAFLVLGAILGILVFAGGARTPPGESRSIALGLTGIAGVASLLISLSVNQTATAGVLLSSIWILGAFLTYGTLLSWVYERLLILEPGPTAETSRPTAAAQPEPGGGPLEAREGLPPEAPSAAAEPPVVSMRRPAEEPQLARLSRRRFLIRLGGATATVTLLGVALGRVVSDGAEEEPPVPEEPAIPLPNAGDPVQPVPGTRPEYTSVEEHYRIDINTRAPRIAQEDWSLELGGLVQRPRALTLADLRAYPPRRQFVTLSCISNPIAGPLIGTTLWTGVPFSMVLADAGVLPQATHVRLTSEDGFHEVIALDLVNQDERIMLTYAWNEAPLTREHGFPLRVYIPDRYGMKQPKWITGIELIDEFREGYWVARGWDREAIMNATSVIDTIAVKQAFQRGADRLIPVGGIAHAGARSLSAVEVQTDDGPWQAARLRAPFSQTTWVIWRFDWPFTQGEHTLRVRCVDGEGSPQVEEESDTHPSGATGLHSQEVDV